MKKVMPYLISVLVTIVLLELVARVSLTKFANQEQFKLLASRRQFTKRYGKDKYIAHRYCGNIPRPNYRSENNWHNSLGYRGNEIGAKKEGEHRILCLGGSTTYGTRLSPQEAYPAQLEKTLRTSGHDVSVINGGVEGYTSWEILASLLFRAPEINPDIVIVYQGY